MIATLRMMAARVVQTYTNPTPKEPMQLNLKSLQLIGARLSYLKSLTLDLNHKDLAYDTYSSAGRPAVRVTHKPSGMFGECAYERSEHKNRQMAHTALLADMVLYPDKWKAPTPEANEPSLVDGQMRDLMQGLGAGEDHEDVQAALVSAGFESSTAEAIRARVVGGPEFQGRVKPWLLATFGQEIASDKGERNQRFLEESLELVQSTGLTASEAHQLVDYVYGRPVGEPVQETGGVMVTLAALCLANGLNMHQAGEDELTRVWTKVAQIRAKNAAKPKHSPLPGTDQVEQPAPAAPVQGGAGGFALRGSKVGGSYQADGTVVAVFNTLAGERRYVFEFDTPKGMLHIFNPLQVVLETDQAKDAP